MTKQYAWVKGYPGKVDAEIAGARLEQLHDTHGQQLTARIVLDDARPADAPLHPCFEWDDVRAAELWREREAQGLMRNIRVVVVSSDDTPEPPRKVFVNVVEQRGDDTDRVYTTVTRAMSEPELRRQVLDTAIRDVAVLQRKYDAFTEIADTFRETSDRLTAVRDSIFDQANV